MSHALTPSETDVLRLMACGLSNAQIAAIRCNSESTIRLTFARAIFAKLGVTSRTQAALYAWREGVIDVNEAWDTLMLVTETEGVTSTNGRNGV